MTDTIAAKEKALRTTGNIGYLLMGAGNVAVGFFIVTLGFSNKIVFADTVWCIALDIAALALTIWFNSKKKLLLPA
jgi:hypothetical protein